MVRGAGEVVVPGDGAHWSGALAAEHFPEARQVVAWDHATRYLWQVATAVDGEGTDPAKQWAKARRDGLWHGKGAAVRAACRAHAAVGKPVQEAITYSTNNRERMRYPLPGVARAGHPDRQRGGGAWRQPRARRAVATGRDDLAARRGPRGGHGAHVAEARAVGRGHGVAAPRHRAYHHQAA